MRAIYGVAICHNRLMAVPIEPSALTPSYDPFLVVVSYLVAVGASYAALDMTERIAIARGRARGVWFLAGAGTMGAGIWSMHFIGMLAFRLPVPTSDTYDVALTAVSMGVAVLASGLALGIAARRRLDMPRLLGGGVAMGLGIAAMHYLGMAAMRAPCVAAYAPAPVLASLAIAVGASIAALGLAFHFQGEARSASAYAWSWAKVASALVMGGAIAGMHYMGMAAGRYVLVCGPGLTPSPLTPAGLVSVSSLGGGAIALGALLVTLLAIMSSYRERLRWQQDVQKDRFLGILSHELRTPLNAIVGYGSILQDGLLGPMPAAQTQAVGRMMEGAEGMLELVGDLLDMSQIQAGKLTVSVQPLDLVAEAQAVCEALGPRAEAKSLTLALRLPPQLPAVLGDARRVRQVLANLVANAIKFTPAGGLITIGAGAERAQLRVEVQDTGVGIPAGARARLFEPFTQLDMSETRGAGGVGLGLAIARALVEAQGGRIGVASEPGQGSTFWFTLPVAPHAPPRASAGPRPRPDLMRSAVP